MGQVTLFCVIVDCPQGVFSIQIDTNRSLGHLKDAIKADNSILIRCDAIDMQLFLTKREGGHGAWMTQESVHKALLKPGGCND